jgi:hypothetical protein
MDRPINLTDERTIKAMALEAKQRGVRWGPIRTTRDPNRPSIVEIECGWIPDGGVPLKPAERLGIETMAAVRLKPPAPAPAVH